MWAWQNSTQTLLLNTPYNISSFGEDQSGELYITSLGGAVYKINPAPTAGTADVSGRITSATGRGISNARIILSGGNLATPVYALTNAFGYYRFLDMQVGLNYVITVISKRLNFTPASQTFTLNKGRTNVDFVADAPSSDDFR